MKKQCMVIVLTMVMAACATAQTEQPEDIWQPFRFLDGTWHGTGDGMSGTSTVSQSYEFVLGDQFLKMQTKSIFQPQEKNPKGETHEDLGVISYDQARKTFVLRAFYIEGFVNTYVLIDKADDGSEFTFETESVENAPPGTKAKFVISKTSEEAFETNFFVSFGGGDYTCFSTNRMTRG